MENNDKFLTEGEGNIEELFEMLKDKMPVPDEMKDITLAAYTYVLSL